MRDTSTKTDNSGDTFNADTFNQLNNELENLVSSANISLDLEGGPDTNLFMLAIAMATYAGAGATYIDTGSASTYVLSTPDTLKTPESYYDGMMVAFKATNDSSSGSDNIKVGLLSAEDFTKSDGSALDVDSVLEDNIVYAIYNLSNTRFELVNPNIFATLAETEARTRLDKAITPSTLGATGQTGTIDRWPEPIAVPSGFLECDGSAVSRTTYAALFGVIGTTFGIGDGSTTFNLPNIATIDGGNSVDLIAIIKT